MSLALISGYCNVSLIKSPAICLNVVPPPGTIPSAKADFVASTASITLSLRSLSSTSVLAPTLIIAAPEISLANLSLSLSFSKSESVSSICLRIASARASILSGAPMPPTILVVFSLLITLSAFPSHSILNSSSFIFFSLEITVAPVKTAMSSR